MFKLKEVVEPKFEVELLDGSMKEYDPWKLQLALFEAHQASTGDGRAMYDGIRKAFGFPIESEGSTLTCNQCLALESALGDYVDELPVSKKILARQSSDSSASPSPK